MPDIEGVPYETTGTPLDQASAQTLSARFREAISAGVAAGTEAKALAQSVVAEVGTIRTAVVQSANSASAASASASAAAGSAAQAEQTAADLVPRVEQIEAMAGLAPGEVTDAQTANLISQPTTSTRTALSAATVPRDSAGMGEPVQAFLRSLPDPGGDNGVVTEDVTSRVTLESWQTPHYYDRVADEKPGEVLRMDVMDPVAKAMHAWRLPADPEIPYHPETNPMATVVWVGAHWDSPPRGSYDLHGHWSVEVPNSQGRIETRFQVKFVNPSTNKIGTDLAQIITTAADFAVTTSPSGEFGNAGGVPMFRIGGANDTQKIIQFSTSASRNQTRARWQLMMNDQTESGSNAGSNFLLQRLSDSGAFLENSMFIERKTGRFGFGTLAGPVSGPTDFSPAKFSISWDPSSADTASGMFFRPSAQMAPNGAIVRARFRHGSDRMLSSEVAGEPNLRYIMTAQGTQEWGDGTNARDVTLSRHSPGVLQTNGQFHTGGTLRIGTSSVGAGEKVLAIGNATAVPASTPTAGGVLYVEGGALKYLGSNGTRTTIAPA